MVLALALTLAGPLPAAAATTPSLGEAASFGVLANTYTNTVAGTTIDGDLGYTTGPATNPVVTGTTHTGDATYNQAGTDQGAALTALASQPCTFTFGGGAIDLSTDTTHGPIGVYEPGVYCSAGAMDIGGPLTLDGAGTYIFRPGGALTSTANATVTLSGASACDVFWTPTQATTLAADTTFHGTVIDDAGITIGANTTWTGRALAFGGTVTTDTNTITAPTCADPTPPSGTPQPSTITVIKRVINDNGRTETVSDFDLFVDGTPVVSGETNTFAATPGVYTVTETENPNYTLAFSGDCDLNGQMNLTAGQNKTCIVTNDDIGAPVVVPPVPPLIDVVKVPSPLSLPDGPGNVTYTYTLRNVGTVPVTDITMVGDTCSPLVRVSGDVNGDNQLQVDETWVYTCSTTLSETHTNTIVATGWANGITATDIANATVVVGEPVVPPLINVTKVPSPLTLLAGGGNVTYTYRVTNPGTEPLTNVTLSDDKCGASFVSGDSDLDAMLDSGETWMYTCSSNLTQTTNNTVVVSGQANGLTARDLAIATVTVAAATPTFPQTGFSSAEASTPWSDLAIVFGVLSASFLLYAARRKRIG